MKEEKVSFETAVIAKEKGFPKITFNRYASNGELCEINNFPTQSLLQKWIREEHKLHIVIIPNILYFTFKIIDIQDNPSNNIERPPYKNVHSTDYNTYEEALGVGLQELLKLIP